MCLEGCIAASGLRHGSGVTVVMIRKADETNAEDAKASLGSISIFQERKGELEAETVLGRLILLEPLSSMLVNYPFEVCGGCFDQLERSRELVGFSVRTRM